MCNALWYCPVNKHWIINLRISAGSRGLLSDTLMSSNKNNDLTRCNCYCNNSWTRRILITADSDSDATTLLNVRSLLRQAGTCQGPGASHHGLHPGPRGLANIELQRGGGGRPHSTQAPEIKLWWRLLSQRFKLRLRLEIPLDHFSLSHMKYMKNFLWRDLLFCHIK